VTVLLEAGAGAERERPDAHDWLEVTGLSPLEDEPVELLVAPELVDAVALVEPAVLPVVVPVVVAPAVELVVAAVAAWVCVLRASAGSWPVTSTTVITIHTARNSATEPPMTRARILRTRALRASLILMPSSLVMAVSIRRARSNAV
jgi:hypothetical protein